jgi:serine/threonine-protein kinase
MSKYVVKQKLGEIGGYLVVFAAHQKGLERDVELRVLQALVDEDSDVYAKFQAECKVLASLDHPGILKILDLGHAEKRVFYVTDPPPGVPLKETIAQGALPADVVLEVGVQLGQALDHLHARGMLHRGLSLAGIHYDLVTGRVIICDFSLLKSASGNVPSMRDLVDTDTFEALPERACNWPIDARSDVFLAGAVLYGMLTGQDPLAPANLTRVPDYQFQAPGIVNPDCPLELDKFVLKAMAKRPDERHQSAAEFVRDLENVRRRLVVRKASRTMPVMATGLQQALQAAAASAGRAGQEDAASASSAPPAVATPTLFDSLKQRVQSASRPGQQDSLPPAVVLGGGVVLILLAAFIKLAFLPDRPPEPPKPVVASTRKGARLKASQVKYTPSTAAASAVAAPPSEPAPVARAPESEPEPGSEEKPPPERPLATPVLPESGGGSTAASGDLGSLVTEAAENPTTQKTFNGRWEALRTWAEQMPPPGPGVTQPFSPIDLTAVRLKVYRDPKEACADLDEMFKKVGGTLHR